MEKFHDYRDAYTGIAPFLPAGSVSKLLGLVRLPLAAVVLCVALLWDLLVPVRLVRMAGNWLLCRLLLLSMGFFWMESAVVGRSVPVGRVHVSNHKSYVDLFYWAMWAPSAYVFMRGHRMLVCRNLATALAARLRGLSVLDDESDALTVPSSGLSKLPGTLVVFVEGESTNHERCVLRLDEQCVAAFQSIPSYQLHILAYSNRGVPFLGLSDQSAIGHFLGASGQPWQRLKVYTMASGGNGSLDDNWDRLATSSTFKPLKLGWQEKRSFLTAWTAERKK